MLWGDFWDESALTVNMGMDSLGQRDSFIISPHFYKNKRVNLVKIIFKDSSLILELFELEVGVVSAVGGNKRDQKKARGRERGNVSGKKAAGAALPVAGTWRTFS